MPLFEESFITYWTNPINQVADLEDRIYYDTAPERDTSADFYAVLSLVNSDPFHTHDKTPANPETLILRRYQVSVFGPRQTTVWTIHEAFRRALDGFEGVMEDHRVGSILCNPDRDMPRDDDSRMFHRLLDFNVGYRAI